MPGKARGSARVNLRQGKGQCKARQRCIKQCPQLFYSNAVAFANVLLSTLHVNTIFCLCSKASAFAIFCCMASCLSHVNAVILAGLGHSSVLLLCNGLYVNTPVSVLYSKGRVMTSVLVL